MRRRTVPGGRRSPRGARWVGDGMRILLASLDELERNEVEECEVLTRLVERMIVLPEEAL